MESLSDIVAQMRGRGEDGRMDRHLWNEYADRIEAIAKRERAPVGNADALRKALVQVIRLANVTADGENWDWNNAIAENVVKVVKEALSAPPRQCDVGTPGEQWVRFESFCKRKGDGFSASAYCAYECPCGNKGDCKLAWAQTPYAAQEGGAE